MEIENKEGSESPLPNGSTHPPKRGRGRPRGSLNKKFTVEKAPTHNARPSKKVDFFSPDIVIKTKVKKRGRPKKIKMPGRPRKIPLTPEEESERLQRLSLQRKRKLSKPLGRPRIHPVAEGSKAKRGRGRPRKSDDAGAHKGSGEISLDVSNGAPRKRGRPSGAMKRKRGRPAGPSKVSIAKSSDGTPKKRGRPPGSANKVKKIQRVDGTPRKRGRPPGSGSGSSTKLKIIRRNADGTPRKRGRPPGSGKKVKIAEKKVGDSPRKRGRPPGTGKVKAQGGSAEGATADGAPRRKRGRPSKVRLAVVLEKLPSEYPDEEETDAPSPKQSRTSDDSSQNQNDDEEETRASENDADPEDEEENAIDCSKVNNTSENEMVGKFKKKK
ncbi:chromosomal protein D1 [Pseudorasbora parva]|uniref:chromosomal protein D1 n=1 Tax=Pseudorasbora parva TaxID=51549 RepID=UPI00351E095C